MANKRNLIYPELSYKIIGVIFEVYNQLKYGHREKVYQKAIAEIFKERSIHFKKEVYYPVKINGTIISRYYFDFLVEDKIVLEIKVAEGFYQKDFHQLLSYIKFENYQLGILAIFSKQGIKYRRLLNLY
jgi:GxxExxY protein